jgi:uncharacterized SAM-binding protein YcdF (DUF218 family)
MGVVRRAALLAVIALSLICGVGLMRFVGDLPTTVSEPDVRTDAIVVLTGGSGRLVEGLALLEGGVAEKLFVSGVYRGVDVEELLRVARADGGSDSVARIALGHEADDTRGNAHETAAWMAEQGYNSLRLVTAAYHMPRSLLEFARAMPDVSVIPHPVFPGTVTLLGSEYAKYLLARLAIR